MANYDTDFYDDKARLEILEIKRKFPDKIFALAPYEIPTAPGFYKLKVAVLGADDFAADPSDGIFAYKLEAGDWARKIDGMLGRDRATSEAIIADVARRAELLEHGDEPVAAVYLTRGELQILMETGVDAGYNPGNPEDNDPELENSMQKLDAALNELAGGFRMAR